MSDIIGWSNVPSDILFRVAVHQQMSLADVARMAAVCKPWSSILHENNWYGLPISAIIGKTSFPWLMLAESKSASSNTADNGRRFVNPATGEVIELYLPEAKGRRCAGSGYGWIVTMSKNAEINLLNPLSREQLKLPPKFKWIDGRVNDLTLWPSPDKCLNPDRPSNFSFTADEFMNYCFTRRELLTMFIQKAILTSSPSSSECMVVALIRQDDCAHEIACTKLGHPEWTQIPSPVFPEKEWTWQAEDYIFYQGKLFALSCEGDLWVLDDLYRNIYTGWKVISPRLEYRTYLSVRMDQADETCQCYLAEIAGEFIVVARKIEKKKGKAGKTLKIAVFKLLQEQWCRVYEIGDCCLFLGINEAICLSPPPAGFHSNCIYFADDLYFSPYWYIPGCDMVVYTMEKDELSPLHEEVVYDISPSLWVPFN